MNEIHIADSDIELGQFRPFVLKTAWSIDKSNDYRKVRKDIAAIRALMPKVYHDIAARAAHPRLARRLGRDAERAGQEIGAFITGIADGPTEVYKETVAKQVLRAYRGVNDRIFPEYSMPSLGTEAMDRHPDLIETIVDAAEALETA